MADEARLELLMFQGEAQRKVNLLNNRAAEESSHLEARLKSYQKQVFDLMTELCQARSDGSRDRMDLEHAWRDTGRCRKEREKARKIAKKTEAEAACRAKELDKAKAEAADQITALNKDLASSREKCSELEHQTFEVDNEITLAIEKYKSSEEFARGWIQFSKEAYKVGASKVRARVIQEYPDINLSFLEDEGYYFPSPTAEAMAVTSPSNDGNDDEDVPGINFDVTTEGDPAEAPTEIARGSGTSRPDVKEARVSQTFAEEDPSLGPSNRI